MHWKPVIGRLAARARAAGRRPARPRRLGPAARRRRPHSDRLRRGCSAGCSTSSGLDSVARRRQLGRRLDRAGAGQERQGALRRRDRPGRPLGEARPLALRLRALEPAQDGSRLRLGSRRRCCASPIGRTLLMGGTVGRPRQMPAADAIEMAEIYASTPCFERAPRRDAAGPVRRRRRGSRCRSPLAWGEKDRLLPAKARLTRRAPGRRPQGDAAGLRPPADVGRPGARQPHDPRVASGTAGRRPPRRRSRAPSRRRSRAS